MNPFVIFLLGLLVGWLVEWIIDWVYWRRKRTVRQPDGLEECRKRVASLEQEIASYQNQLAAFQTQSARSYTIPVANEVEHPVKDTTQVSEQFVSGDRLEDIQGITSELAALLKKAGISTFASLGMLRPQKLKEILGEQALPPGSQVEIIKQARLFSKQIPKVDDLEIIVGIGPVIAGILNNAGIFTFLELSTLTAEELREIVGERIQRLANEEQILSQARQLAEEQNRGG